MTADERIDRAVELLPGGELSQYTRQLWRTTIETAVEEEREACAKIADDASNRVQSQNQVGWGMRSIADHIGTAIRERRNESESYGAGFNDDDWDVAEDEGHDN